MNYVFLFVAFTMYATGLFSQRYVNVSGIVLEQGTNERLNGATISGIDSRTTVISNESGYFSIQVPIGKVNLKLSYLGYISTEFELDTKKDTFVLMYLRQRFIELDTFTVSASARQLTPARLGLMTLPMSQLQKVPTLFGEKDLIKAIQLLPGVQTGNEGSTGYYVRGGGPDQNLILLDGSPVYNVSHLFGFFSLFPPEPIKTVHFYKGGFPARFGGRLSSVLDIQMKDGNQKKYSGGLSVGLLASKFSLEGPIAKGKSSFFISGRRTYFDVLTRPFMDKNRNTGGYYFYDGTVRLNFQINEKNRLFLSSYLGRDKFKTAIKDTRTSEEETSQSLVDTYFGWGNRTLAARWSQVVSNKVQVQYSVNATEFEYNLGFASQQTSGATESRKFNFDYSSAIRDLSGKWEFDWFASNSIKFKGGASYTRHWFDPFFSNINREEAGVDTIVNQNGRRIRTSESTVFLESDLALNRRIDMNLGVHSNFYNVDDRQYFSVQPRLTVDYKFSDESVVSGSYAFMQQPIHLLTNNGPGLPTDLWVPATDKAPPQRAFQYSVGYRRKYALFEISVETYYKLMKGVIEYTEGANFLNTNVNWEDKIEKGKGESYGAEFLVQKKSGRLSGWMGYTLSWNKRTFPFLNGGKPFYYKYDHRHDFKMVIIYKIKPSIDLSLSFMLNSGNWITLPSAFYAGAAGSFSYQFPDFMFGTNNSDYIYRNGNRNNVRMKTYHRADISIDFNKARKKGMRTWNISLYNAYSRQNPYLYYYSQHTNGQMKLRQISLFPIIPSVTYSFKWK